MPQLPLKIDNYLKDIDSVWQALHSKADFVVQNHVDDLEKRLSKVVFIYDKRKKENPSYLTSFSQTVVNKILANTAITLLQKNPSIIVAEPTEEDTLFFTAQYGEKTCYVEVYFEENETPTCTLNIFENKEVILSRVGTVQNVLNTFSAFDLTFNA